MRKAVLRAIDEKRNPMPGREPGLDDLQVYLRAHPRLQAPLLVWLRVLEAEAATDAREPTEEAP